MAEELKTYCRICEPLCGMVATVEDGELTQLRPDKDHPLSKGFACPKGIAFAEVHNDPDRVLHPLRKNASGELPTLYGFRIFDLWTWTNSANPDDYELRP